MAWLLDCARERLDSQPQGGPPTAMPSREGLKPSPGTDVAQSPRTGNPSPKTARHTLSEHHKVGNNAWQAGKRPLAAPRRRILVPRGPTGSCVSSPPHEISARPRALAIIPAY
jgi:hypothetical protein